MGPEPPIRDGAGVADPRWGRSRRSAMGPESLTRYGTQAGDVSPVRAVHVACGSGGWRDGGAEGPGQRASPAIGVAGGRRDRRTAWLADGATGDRRGWRTARPADGMAGGRRDRRAAWLADGATGERHGLRPDYGRGFSATRWRRASKRGSSRRALRSGSWASRSGRR